MIRENFRVIDLFQILIKSIGSRLYGVLWSKKSDVNSLMNQYLSKIDSLLGTNAPLKNINKKHLKFLTKPWITLGLQNSIKRKNDIYSKFAKCKNQKRKKFYHSNYKTYKNILSALLKRAKEKYFNKFVHINIKILRPWQQLNPCWQWNKNNYTPSRIKNDEKYINDAIKIANILYWDGSVKTLHKKPYFLFPNVLKRWFFQNNRSGIWSFLYYQER